MVGGVLNVGLTFRMIKTICEWSLKPFGHHSPYMYVIDFINTFTENIALLNNLTSLDTLK